MVSMSDYESAGLSSILYPLQCRTFERRGSVAVFQGHRGMVTSLDWRPMTPPDPSVVFLSSALDDTLRLWHVDRRDSHCILKNPQVCVCVCVCVCIIYVFFFLWVSFNLFLIFALFVLVYLIFF